MPTITLLRSFGGFDALSSSFFSDLRDAPIISSSSTELVFSASDTDASRVAFIGTGFTYDAFGVSTGTIKRVVFDNPSQGVTFFDWTGLNVSANLVTTYVLTSNWTALNTLLFSTSDTYNLTNGADRVRGFGGNDIMRGFNGNDRLLGDNGNDSLFGDAGADILTGGTGADRLVGGAGIDTMVGGAGADAFVFTHAGATNRDIITDFRAVDDSLQFDNAAFTAFNYTGRLRTADFVAGTNATDAADRFIYQKSTGNLWYDRDGSGAAAKVLVAELVDATALTAADIFIF